MAKLDGGSTALPEKHPSSHAGGEAGTAVAASLSRPRQFIDVVALMQHVEGDQELLRDIVRVFAETLPAMLEKLRAGIAGNHPAEVHEAAHAIRGAARNFFAPSVESAAMALERSGNEGHLSGATAALRELEEEVGRLQEALAALVRGGECL